MFAKMVFLPKMADNVFLKALENLEALEALEFFETLEYIGTNGNEECL
jgi:hypothetical protein